VTLPEQDERPERSRSAEVLSTGLLDGSSGLGVAAAAAAAAAQPCSLDSFPNCKRLIDAHRKILRIANKTPLSVLHEYASRLNLEVSRRPSSFPPVSSLSCCRTSSSMRLSRLCSTETYRMEVRARHVENTLSSFPFP
jgi:hypothetical protein